MSYTSNTSGKENVPPKSLTPKRKTPATKINENWIRLGDFSLEEEMYKNGRIHHYVFTSYLNKTYKDVPCVLRSMGGYGRVNNLRTMRYECSHSSEHGNCRRQYKVFQVLGNKFELYRNDEDITHSSGVKIVGHVRGERRNEVKTKLSTMTAEQYLAECEDKADKQLIGNGNLQDCISYSTAAKIRSEVLQAVDFDKDDIIDLLMKICQDLNMESADGPSNYIWIRSSSHYLATNNFNALR